MRHCPFCKVPHPETEAFYRRKRSGDLFDRCRAFNAHQSALKAQNRAKQASPAPAEPRGAVEPLLRLAQSEAWG